MTDAEQQPERYSVVEAASLLGISERAVRKRIQAGTLPAERVDGRWRVALARVGPAPKAQTGETTAGPGTSRRATRNNQPERLHAAARAREAGSSGTANSVPAEHASELLRMVADLQRRNLELAGQVGFLQARLATTQEQLLLAESSDESEEVPELPERRSLLDRLLRR
jgi:excisionase family DNA binding protein